LPKRKRGRPKKEEALARRQALSEMGLITPGQESDPRRQKSTSGAELSVKGKKK
jgi:hypothetical protein